MPALFIFIAYFAITLLCGVLLAYPLHMFLSIWFELDFDRVVSRTVLLLAIILLFPVCKFLNINSWQKIGYPDSRKAFFADLFKGIGLGIIIMLPVIGGLIITQNRVFDSGWEVSLSNIAALLVTALVAGILVGLIEESLFRGAMLTAVKQQSSFFLAAFATSFVYALVHFLQPSIEINTELINWASGFVILKDALLQLTHVAEIADSFIALFLAGLLLAIVRMRSNRLALCIGIHAGWVIAIKVFKRVTDSNPQSEYAFLTGSYDKVIGYLAATCIAIFIVLLLKLSKNNKQ